jgi:pyruvate/2-oxoglutarate dehydrogenase complex dihydrolipoamide acyltransferase (E2) component
MKAGGLPAVCAHLTSPQLCRFAASLLRAVCMPCTHRQPQAAMCSAPGLEQRAASAAEQATPDSRDSVGVGLDTIFDDDLAAAKNDTSNHSSTSPDIAPDAADATAAAAAAAAAAADAGAGSPQRRLTASTVYQAGSWTAAVAGRVVAVALEAELPPVVKECECLLSGSGSASC